MADKRPEELIDYWPKDVGLDDFRQGYLVGKHDGFKAGYEERIQRRDWQGKLDASRPCRPQRLSR